MSHKDHVSPIVYRRSKTVAGSCLLFTVFIYTSYIYNDYLSTLLGCMMLPPAFMSDYWFLNRYGTLRQQQALLLDKFTALLYMLWMHVLLCCSCGIFVSTFNFIFLLWVHHWTALSKTFSQWRLRHSLWHVVIVINIAYWMCIGTHGRFGLFFSIQSLGYLPANSVCELKIFDLPQFQMVELAGWSNISCVALNASAFIITVGSCFIENNSKKKLLVKGFATVCSGITIIPIAYSKRISIT